MEPTEAKPVKVLYIGSSKEPIKILNDSSLFNILKVDTSIEAVSYLKQKQNVDAIICETYIFLNDGLQVKEILNHKGLLHDTPFILISMIDNPEFFLKAFVSGIVDYYTFPVDPERILKRITFLKQNIVEVDTASKEEKVIHEKSKKNRYKTPFLKRAFDVTFAGLALLFLSPLMLLVIIAIKLESKGPFYYVSKRIGANMDEFGFLKFRSMHVNADKLLSKEEVATLNQYAKEVIEECPRCAELPEGKYCKPLTYGDDGEIICEHLKALREDAKATFIKLENDPRVTKVGKFIRNTSIDELPQLINIIKGDMSIVGNRPLPEYEAEILSNDIRHKRFFAAAGLTGLWQVELRGKDGDMSREERFELDVKYAENNSFWGDIKLIFRTFKIFIQPGNV